jgi:hypothetical protein
MQVPLCLSSENVCDHSLESSNCSKARYCKARCCVQGALRHTMNHGCVAAVSTVAATAVNLVSFTCNKLQSGDYACEHVCHYRPYDTPITDLELPAAAAQAVERSGVLLLQTVPQNDAQNDALLQSREHIMIVSSPFRRCLQTAGEVARQLQIDEVYVHLQLGERMDKVRTLVKV